MHGNIDNYNRKQSIKLITGGDFDVFHPTYYDPYFLKYLGDRPFVLTIHDMIHDIYPEHFSLDDKTSENIRALAHKAKNIIAVSECTKKDAVKFLGVDEDKVHVVYHGCSLGIDKKGAVPDGSVINGLPEKYLLYVGDRGRYKNFYFFISAILPLLKEDPGLQVVCAGGGSFMPMEKSFFNVLGIARRLYQYTVNDDTLAILYKRAIAFVFPSEYEGFGIPVLEAFTCGCPAVISASSSLPEVGADAAIYFYPKDVLSIRNALKSVVEDDGLRDSMIKKGLDRAKIFSWEKTAKETLAIYRKVSP